MFALALWLWSSWFAPGPEACGDETGDQSGPRRVSVDLKDPFGRRGDSADDSVVAGFDQPRTSARRVSVDLKDPFGRRDAGPDGSSARARRVSPDLKDPFGHGEATRVPSPAPNGGRVRPDMKDPFANGVPASRRVTPNLKDPFGRSR